MASAGRHWLKVPTVGEAKPKNILFSSDVAPVIKVLFAF